MIIVRLVMFLHQADSGVFLFLFEAHKFYSVISRWNSSNGRKNLHLANRVLLLLRYVYTFGSCSSHTLSCIQTLFSHTLIKTHKNQSFWVLVGKNFLRYGIRCPCHVKWRNQHSLLNKLIRTWFLYARVYNLMLNVTSKMLTY